MSKVHSCAPITSPGAIIVLLAVALSGPIPMLISPIYIGGLVEYIGLTEAQSGYLASLESLGAGLATLPALWWILRCNWQKVAFYAMLVAALGNLLSVYIQDFTALAILRIVVGIGWASGMCVSIVGLSNTLNPVKYFSYWVLFELFLTAILLAVMPKLIAMTSSVTVVFLVVAVCQGIVLLFYRKLPVSGKSIGDVGSFRALGQISMKGYLSLLALFMLYAGMFGIFSFVERMGLAENFTRDEINSILLISLGFGILGALHSSRLSGSVDRTKIIYGGALIFVVSVVALIFPLSYLLFALGAALFNLSWKALTPTYMGIIASHDKTGQLMVLSTALVGLGFSCGVALLASVIQYGGYVAVIVVGAVMTLISFILALVSLTFPEKSLVKEGVYG